MALYSVSCILILAPSVALIYVPLKRMRVVRIVLNCHITCKTLNPGSQTNPTYLLVCVVYRCKCE